LASGGGLGDGEWPVASLGVMPAEAIRSIALVEAPRGFDDDPKNE
jgi:hypothetical protein